MRLFAKIFLWFLAAMALTAAVMIFVTRTFQTDPLFSRLQRSTRNQMQIFAGTATQIAGAEGEAGLRAYLGRLRDVDPPRDINVVGSDGKVWFGEESTIPNSSEIVARTLSTNSVETDTSSDDRTVGAAPIVFPGGGRSVLVVQWERQPSPSLFWGSTPAYFRLGGLLLTALILCYLLALYLSRPIGKLRAATQTLAAGQLNTRVSDRLGRRRDELGDLARDFNVMAERIEGLITSQQRLNRDISHELRSPLARMNVALEIAKQRVTPETRPLLTRIETESERLNEMISRLLTLAKLETGSEVVEPIRIDLAELVKDVAEDADFEAKARSRSVEVETNGTCTVAGNEELLRSAIENVLRNAVRYTREGTVVDVRLASNNGTAVVSVSDHGGGVPDAELQNLFRPFYRVGEDRTRSTGGTGLGLAIAERAIKAHKGTITARNTNDGLLVEISLKKYAG
jgi:two-component system sensor histidine kinase CpxA